MKKLKDILKESNIQMGKVYSNPYATAFVKENEEQEEPQMELTDEQKKAFLEAVKQYKKYGEAVYRNAGLSEVYEAIKNMVEVAGKMTISETGDWFDNVTVSRHMKRMGESFNVFEKTLKEVSTLQQRLEASYDEIGEVLGKYYEISEELDPVGKEDGDIDNDGDEDASDEYLANRRKVISKAIKNESMKLTDMIKKPSVNEASLELKKLEDAIKMFQDKIEKQGRVTNARDEEHLQNLIKVYKQMGGKNIKESVVNEAKYDIGMARKGNGITVYNRAEEEKGDYKNVAHISDNGTVKYFDKKLPNDVKKKIEAEAQKMKESIKESHFKVGDKVEMSHGGIGVIKSLDKEDGADDEKYYNVELPNGDIMKHAPNELKLVESVNEGTKMIKLKNLLNESFGMGELPSSKLMKMKVSANKMLDSVNEMQVVNKKTGKDITKHLLDLLSGKIDRKEFEKLTGLKKESKSMDTDKIQESLTQKISGINFEIRRSPVGLMFKFKNPSEFRKSNINVNDLVNTITKMLDSKFGKGSYTFLPSGRLQDDPTINGLEFGVNISKLF
jgi:hypothetical protein